MAKPRPTVAIPFYALHVSHNLIPSISALTMYYDVDTAGRLLEGPVVHVEGTSGEWVNGRRIETGWTITVSAFIEAEGLDALDEAWKQLRADILAGRIIGRQVPSPR